MKLCSPLANQNKAYRTRHECFSRFLFKMQMKIIGLWNAVLISRYSLKTERQVEEMFSSVTEFSFTCGQKRAMIERWNGGKTPEILKGGNTEWRI